MIVLSLNEVQVTAKKAARGAGYPWGLAEEAGYAVRWLCSQGLDGCAALANLLTRFDGTPFDIRTPDTNQPIWKPGGDFILCPLIVGAAISDRADELSHRSFRTTSVAEPSLLFAFAAYCARRLNCTVRVEWPDGAAISDGMRITQHGHLGSIADSVCVQRGGAIETPNQVFSRAELVPSVLKTLNEFAQRTYAPATEESRQKGAGAELRDGN